MKSLDLNIPDKWQCIVRGSLYASTDPDDLSEDMVEVRLPNGILVSAGWCDTVNRYVITVAMDGRLIIPPSYTESALVAADRIIERVEGFRWRNLNMPSTDDTDDTESPPRVVRRDQTTNQLKVAEVVG